MTSVELRKLADGLRQTARNIEKVRKTSTLTPGLDLAAWYLEDKAQQLDEDGASAVQ